MEALEQGSIDNLCGLYAAINALRLVTLKSARRDRALFETGVGYLEKKEWLSTVLTEGMPTRLFAALAQHLAGKHGLQFARMASSRKWHRPEEAVMSAIRAGMPVLTSIDPPLDHYSVICGYSPSRWLLFDSYGYKWLSRAQCSFHQQKNARHVMSAWVMEPINPQPVIEEQAAQQLLLPIPLTRQRSNAHNAAQSC